MYHTLTQWFSQQPKWLHEAARRLSTKCSLNETDINELTALCIKEAGSSINIQPFEFKSEGDSQAIGEPIHIDSISNIHNVNALAPTIPLSFKDNGLTIIYGGNGSGKSGYVRILKDACSARKKEDVLPNAYKPDRSKPSCNIQYSKGEDTNIFEWSKGKTCDDLITVDFFDTSCSRLFIHDENELRYEPEILAFLSDLVLTCQRVSEEIGNLRRAWTVSKKPVLPDEFIKTSLGRWYSNIDYSTSEEEIKQKCLWTEHDDQEISDLQMRLQSTSPTLQIQALKLKKQHLDNLKQHIVKLSMDLSEESANAIVLAFNIWQRRREIAELAAKTLDVLTPLDGVGSDAWKALWEKARAYSDLYAYKENTFPYIGCEALCPLCQQKLTEDAKSRFVSFEQFVKGELQTDVNNAEKNYTSLLDGIEKCLDLDSITAKMDAAGIGEDLANIIISRYKELSSRKEALKNASSLEVVPNITSDKIWEIFVSGLSTQYSNQVVKLELDAKGDNKPELEASFLSLRVRQCISKQVKHIAEEIERLKKLHLFEKAIQKTNTTALSKRKRDLSESIITEMFKSKLDDELRKMRVEGIEFKIELKVDKGKSLHKFVLSGLHGNYNNHQILSDGELRIVALAAFFAEVSDKKHQTPFVFDDPISSLDQDYEEEVVKRLIELSANRQVLVFTHWLSLMGLLQEYAEKFPTEIETIYIRAENWGKGQPGDPSLSGKNPVSALNALIDGYLPRAKNIYVESGLQDYEPLAKHICSEFRILLERMVEKVLLSEVVVRHRRDIQTKNRIKKLACISPSDCQLFDDLMTRYSRYEHSHSSEAAVQVPNPDELKDDLEKLKNWHCDFKTRCET